MRSIEDFELLSRDKRGLVGIGTLIIFIALILVAAVAAGTIIRTSGALREQARKTGEESIRQVSAGVRVVSSKGRVAGGENVDNVDSLVKLRAGSSGINFEDVIVQYMSDDVETHLRLGENEASGEYLAFSSRDELKDQWSALDDNEFAVVKVVRTGPGIKPYILSSTGSAAEIWFSTKDIEGKVGGALKEEEEATVMIMPKVGIETQTTLIVPPSLQNKEVTEL